ncbi:DsbA family oxidoreductase [Sphingobacterium psychroaquaticum]|uniref:DsbA family oxidoreductase n=1 Tax=Sphingobacterium psychroaquaticum TaxID=561061 RepID=UPI0019D1FB66|nr:DsbA family oxidoreductase [Sphingobacterium psychroaquaticum]
MEKKMKIEVWSDVMCPFCYIGKRRYEASLADLPFADQIELEWKSYQLNPTLETNLDITTYDYLAENKGMSVAQAKAMTAQVAEMAKTVGLDYDFDKAVVANSFRAHEFSHFAKTFGKQDEAEELLFKAYFTEGKNVDDIGVLQELAAALGLDTAGLAKALEAGQYRDAVREDLYEAQQLGVRGVPFFVYNRKYAISGAQDVDVFKQTMEKAFTEWRKENPASPFEVIEGPSCGPEGCE